MSVFLVPDLGEGLHHVEVVAWHVEVGDHVVADQPLVSVETDKALVEIPAPHAGVVVRLHGSPGDVLEIGTPLVELAEPERVGESAGTIVGALPEAVPAGEPAHPGVRASARGPRAHASPLVRRRAAALGVDLAAVEGTGPGGAITNADLERAIGGGAEPLRGVRRTMAEHMTRAHAEVVPATLIDEADVGEWPPGTDVTVRLVRAIAAGCAAEAALNAWFLGPGTGRVLHREVHLGLAVDTRDGLLVPVLPDVRGLTDDALRSAIDETVGAARERALRPDDLRGATITLSNFGEIGGRFAALVVVPPQVAILGAGRVRDRVVARDGVPAVRPVLPLACTFDHRVVTGAEAARFLAAIIDDLEGFPEERG